MCLGVEESDIGLDGGCNVCMCVCFCSQNARVKDDVMMGPMLMNSLLFRKNAFGSMLDPCKFGTVRLLYVFLQLIVKTLLGFHAHIYYHSKV